MAGTARHSPPQAEQLCQFLDTAHISAIWTLNDVLWPPVFGEEWKVNVCYIHDIGSRNDLHLVPYQNLDAYSPYSLREFRVLVSSLVHRWQQRPMSVLLNTEFMQVNIGSATTDRKPASFIFNFKNYKSHQYYHCLLELDLEHMSAVCQLSLISPACHFLSHCLIILALEATMF